MKTETKLIDKALDTLIEEAATDIYRNEGNDLPVEKVEFSPEHKKKMEKLFRRERRKYNLRRALRTAGRVACIILVAAVVMSAAIYSVEAWRVKFLNFVFDSTAPDTEIKFTDTKQNSFYNDVVELRYIPAGFELEESEVSKRHVFLKFVYNDQSFLLKRNNIASNSAVNTEEGTVENITINNYEGIYIEKEDDNILIWHDGVYTYRLAGNIEKEELIKIAENIKSK